MPPRNIDQNGNVQLRFANGNYIETPARSVVGDYFYTDGTARSCMTSSAGSMYGSMYGDFSAGVSTQDLDKLIAKISEFIEPQSSERDFWKSFMKMQDMSCKKETEPAISFEETMGFNT